MRCSEIKSNLPLYSDDVLTPEERAELDGHLDTCPLCRQAISDFQSVKNDLRSLSRHTPSMSFLESLRSAVAAELRPSAAPAFHIIEDKRRWIDAWLMPSTVGTLASLVFASTLLWAILSPTAEQPVFASATTVPVKRPTYLTSNELGLTASEYANTRLSVADESPSINPQGALAALARSLVRGEMRDDEVVVVAEVFGDGLAKIADVVEPSSDDRAVKELRKALESDPAFAPFVPASYDRRADKMRVVLKIQSVNVKVNYNQPVRKTVSVRAGS